VADTKPIKAVVVDDAAFMRRQLVEVLSRSDEIEVVAVARHGVEALDAIKTLHPDVVTLDVDMPVMDGLTTIKHIMIKHPVPVVMVSGLADHGKITFEALRLGAIDFFPKPSGTISKDIKDKGTELIETLKLAARANPLAIKRAFSHAGSCCQQKAPKEMQGVVLILAGRGAVSSFIRLVTALEGLNNLGFISVQHVSETVLTAYGRELTGLLDCVPYSGQGIRLKTRRCVLISEEKVPGVRNGKKDSPFELEGTVNNLNEFASKLSKTLGNRLCTVVLGGEVPDDPSFLSEISSQGGQVYALHPDRCVCSDFPQLIREKGLGHIASGEHDLWRHVQTFSRRLLLEEAQKGSNR